MKSNQASSRSQVLDVIRDRGRISRVELAGATGFTQATISTVVRSLIEDGLVVEPGEWVHTGGKPRSVLTLRAKARTAVGLQLGADWATVVVADARGALIARTRVAGARDDDPHLAVVRLAGVAERLVEASGVSRESLLGVGVVTPGILDLENGIILSSRSLPAWIGFSVRDAIRQATGLDVILDNQAAAAAVGEYWSGGITGSVAHCTIFLGADLGVGIVLAGSIYRGASGNAGIVETTAGPLAVAAKARDALAQGRESTIRLDARSNPFADFAAVAAAAADGDRLGIQLIEDAADHLADVVVGLANILDVDSLTLAGPAFGSAGSIYLQVVRRRIEAEFLARVRHPISVRLASAGVDAGAIGAAALVLQRSLAPRESNLSPLSSVSVSPAGA